MPDIASIGIDLNAKPVVEGAKALDSLAASAAAVEPKIDKVTKAADDLGKASAQVWRYGTDAAKGVDALGEATARTGQRTGVSNGQMSDTVKLMRAQAEEAKATQAANIALGASSTSASIGAQIFIDKLKDQAAVLGMSRSQLAAYQAAQLGVSREAEASIAKIKAYEDAIKSAADAKAAAAKQTSVLADSIKILAAGYSALKLTEYIKDAALLAARYETLGVVTEVVGRNAGYTKTQMDTATDAIARQGITMIEARESATKLVQAHVDLKNATVLARIAQDAAVIGHINSSEAFDRLVNGIARGNVLILRNIGINVSMETAYRQMGETLGKNANELTENERVQARLNAVIERGADIAGTYEAAMDTAGKQITSMQRYTQDLKTVIGETFNETLTIAVMALTDGLKDANKEVTELSKNQQLHEWGRSLADVFVVLLNKVGNATTTMQKTWAWADHMSARDDINSKYDSQIMDPKTQGDFLDVSGRNARIRRINSEREAALAQENVDYLTQQAKLTAQFDAFAKAGQERDATITAKHKAEAEARLKVDQDYATKATALLIANAGKSLEAQQAAQAALAKSVYEGAPTYRDTDPKPAKPKVDKVASTELADQLARYQDEVNASKAMFDHMSRMEDMFHAAGKMGDEEYYELKRDHIEALAQDQAYAYNKQIAELKSYNNGTKEEAAKHAKEIHDIEAKRDAAAVEAQDALSELDTKEMLRKDAVASASQDATNKYLSGLDQEAKKLEEANAAHETSKGAVERETIARLDLAIAAQKQFIADQDLSTASEAEIAAGPATLKYLEDVRAARARIAAGLDQQQSLQYKDKAAEQAIKDWQRAGQNIATSLEDAFGKGGKAIGEMFKAYATGMSEQLRAQKDLAAAKKLADDDPEKFEAIQRAQLNGARAQVQSYGDMTTAAQGFFAEGSKGYQAMHAASMALHSAEVALSLIKGVNAVLTQGEGDPYSAFVRMAAMAALVTGLGVALSGGGGGQTAADLQKSQGTGSVLGDSSAKSQSISRAVELAATNSSIELTHTAGMLASLRNIESSLAGLGSLLVRTSGLTGETGQSSKGAIESLQNNISLGEQITHGAMGKLWGSIFGGKTTVEDTGFTIDPASLGTISTGGLTSYQYAEIKKQGGWFSSDKWSTDESKLGSEADSQFTKVITGLGASISEAADLLGIGGDAFTQKLNSFVVNIGKVSLKDMTGEQIQEALEAVFSKLGDDMAQFSVAGLEQFQQVGEGYFETLTRIAADYANLDSILAATSTTFGATGIASIAAREHLIALAGGIDELASQTNSFTENFLTKAEQLAPVQKYVTDQLAAMGLQSLDTRDKFKEYLLGMANSGALLNTDAPVSEAGQAQYAALLALADAFAKTHAATVDLTKTEQEIADERTDLQDKLDELTMNQAQLAEKARNAIDKTNLALYDQVQAAQAAKDAITEHASILDLQAQLYEVTGNKAAAAAVLEQQHQAALVGLTPAMAAATQALWDAQAAASASEAAMSAVETAFSKVSKVINQQKDILNDAYTKASDALQDRIDASTAAVTKLTNLTQSLQSTLDAMTIPEQAKQERAAAQAEIAAALATAKAGGGLPDADALKGALSVVSKDASSQFSSYLDYQRDLYRTKNAVAGLDDLADTQLTTEQKTLKALQDQKTALDDAHKEDIAALDKQLEMAQLQYDMLNGIFTSLMPLPDALKAFADALGTAQKDPIAGTSALTSLYQDLLGRKPDAAGLKYWQDALAGGLSIGDVANFFTQSDEYKKLHPFAVGTNYVPTDMPALIHEGERIIPAADNRALMARLSSPSGNSDALVTEIRALRAEVRELRSAAEETASNTGSVSKVMKRVGGQGDFLVVKEAV